MSEPSGATRTQRFYTRWARLYDAIAAHTPGVRRERRRAVAALDLSPGDVVVDFGCGTGANLPFLREAVGETGTVVGVDFTPGMVARAAERAAAWENVHVVRGDATRPPIRGVADAVSGATSDGTTPDAVFASFVSGMVEDPAGMVDRWQSLVGEGGRIGLLDLARSTGRGRPLNPLFALIVRASSPPGGSVSAATLAAKLDERVAAAHRQVLENCTETSHETSVFGFVRLSVGRVS